MKPLIWIVTALGLAPIVYLIVVGTTLLSVGQPEVTKLTRAFGRSGLGPMDTHLHDSYVSVGGSRLSFNPRAWVLAIGAVGVVLVLVSLFFLLQAQTTGE